MAEITAKVGKKTDQDKVDKSKAAEGKKPENTAGAEAQNYGTHVIVNATCCNCWAVNVVETSTAHYMTFRCWNCGWYCDV